MICRVLFIDNFDSFTYNLVDYVSEYSETEVILNTAKLNEVYEIDPDAIVISPGPGHPKNPRDVGITNEVLKTVSQSIPTFGVCLGLEAAIHVYGGVVGKAPYPVHGQASDISHDGKGVFKDIAQGFKGARYHSLIAEKVPECFDVTATTIQNENEIVMGIRHLEFPIECVQFHPESVLTEVGRKIIFNFISQIDR
jgi:anthranilate synthase component 2